MKRVAVAGALGLAPIVVVGWGCSDSTTTGVGAAYVDPGGTFGAEITINVIGRGRVTSTIPGIDCPSDCFAKYIFSSASADGATGSVGLKAIPTPGGGFLGWTFETDPVGSRGRGPDNCNPVTRAGAQPNVNAQAQEIALPFGETAGTSPKGQEGACSSFTQVPFVYKITARFEADPPIPDAGPDSGDGGTGEILFNAPVGGGIGREIGFAGSYLYWRVQASTGYSGISYSTNPTTTIIPSTGNTVLSPNANTTVSLLEVDQGGVAYQTSLGSVFISRNGQTPTQMGGVAPFCTALAVDSSSNVYCRSTANTLVQWQFPSYSTPLPLYSGISSGNDLVVESSFGPAYFSTSNAINSLPLSPAPDGGLASPTSVVSGRFGAANLESTSSSSHLWWTESSTLYASSSKSAGSTGMNTLVPSTSGLAYLAPDPNDSSAYWVASSSTIYRADAFGSPTITKLFRSGLSGIGGIAVDTQYVYWTQNDGTVRRASRSGF